MVTINQLFEGNTLKTFLRIKDNYGLPSADLYRFLQVRHYLIQHPDWDYLKRDPTNKEKHLNDLLENSGTMKKQVSLMYKKLMMDISDDTQHFKNQWEMELNITLEDGLWEDICTGCHKGIGSQYWKEFDWKCKIRLFQTPLKSFYSKSCPSDKCWRGCGQVGDQTHIFWDCPRNQTFWKTIKDMLGRALGVDIPCHPEIFLLDVFPEHVTNDQRTLIHILLMIARKMITFNWIKPDPPNTDHWMQKLKHVYTME